MVSKTDKLVVLAVVLVAVVFVGEYFTYGHGTDRDADAEWGAGAVSYTVSSSGSDEYRAVLIGDGGCTPISRLFIYDDPTYDDHYRRACELSVGIDPCYIEEKYYAEQIREALKIRGFTEVEIIGAEKLAEIVSAPAVPGTGVFVLSYALPGTVYSGQTNSPMAQWVSAGGSLYWLGSEVGRFYTDLDGLHRVDGDCTALIFGSAVRTDCADGDPLSYITGTAVDNGFTEALCLKNSTTLFGIDISGFSGLQMGFSDGGFASISSVKVGAGSITVFAGGFDIDQMDDIGQTISAGICPGSTLLELQKGKVVRGTESGEFSFSSSDVRLFIYTGGVYANFARCLHA